jgi:hypothetical protein
MPSRKPAQSGQHADAVCSNLASSLAYSSTLKMEAISSSETLDDLHWITWYYISNYRTLQDFNSFRPTYKHY